MDDASETTPATAELMGLLGQLYVRRQHATKFLLSPQAMLGGEVPADMIRDGREAEVVSALRDWLKENPR